MGTLAAAFLQDLEELDLDDEVPDDVNIKDLDEEADLPIPDAMECYEKSRETLSVVVTNLTKNQDFLKTMLRVRSWSGDTDCKAPENENVVSNLDLVEECNELVGKIDNEIINVHRFIKDIFDKKFPELDSIVYTPLEYIACVKRIQNRTELSGLDLTDLLSNSTIMAVTVSISTSTGVVLPQNEIDIVSAACDEAMQLADCRKDVLTFLEANMSHLAPNVSMILGSALTARLLSIVGGIETLARMPSHNIMHVGSQKRKSMSVSSASEDLTQGVICQCDIIAGTPKEYRNRAIKLVSGKTGLAARIDSFKQAPTGSIGAALRDQIIIGLMKCQEPPPAPTVKPLPVPDEKTRKRRGGKKYRRMKEKFGTTEVQKAANRLAFGVEAEKTYGLEEEEGFGMIGRTGSIGKLKIHAKKNKVQLPKKRAQQMARVHGQSTTTGGTTSSLSFTPLQGIELVVPESTGAGQKSSASGGSKTDYFSNSAKFK